MNISGSWSGLMAGSCGQVKHGLHTRWEMTCVDTQLSASQDELLHVISYLVIWTTRCTIHHIKAYSDGLCYWLSMWPDHRHAIGAHTFQESTNHLKILGARRATWRTLRDHVSLLMTGRSRDNVSLLMTRRSLDNESLLMTGRSRNYVNLLITRRMKPWQWKFTDDKKKPWQWKFTDDRKEAAVTA
jgi:hypothetical protein